jgi:hypothetical protein
MNPSDVPDAQAAWVESRFFDRYSSGTYPFVSVEVVEMPPTRAILFAVHAASHVPPDMWREMVENCFADAKPIKDPVFNRWVGEHGETWAKDMRAKAMAAGDALEGAIIEWAQLNATAASEAGDHTAADQWNWLVDVLWPFSGRARGRVSRVGFALMASDYLREETFDRMIVGFEGIVPLGKISDYNRETD